MLQCVFAGVVHRTQFVIDEEITVVLKACKILGAVEGKIACFVVSTLYKQMINRAGAPEKFS